MQMRSVRVVLLVGPVLFVTAGAAMASDADTVLAKAREAAIAAKHVRYDAEYVPTAWVASRVPKVRGQVLLGDQSEWKLNRFSCKVAITKADSEETTELSAGSDGDVFFLIDPATKTCHEDMDPVVMGSNSRNIQRVVVSELAEAEPYAEDMKAETRELREDSRIGDEDCHQVYCKSEDREVIWHFSKKDHLPRRWERIIKNREEETATLQLTLSNIEVNPKLPADAFKAVVPDGFARTDEFAK